MSCAVSLVASGARKRLNDPIDLFLRERAAVLYGIANSVTLALHEHVFYPGHIVQQLRFDFLHGNLANRFCAIEEGVMREKRMVVLSDRHLAVAKVRSGL